jgi:hypothetical protein
MTNDAMKKAEQEPEKDDDEVISMTVEDAMMEDVDGWSSQ